MVLHSNRQDAIKHNKRSETQDTRKSNTNQMSGIRLQFGITDGDWVTCWMQIALNTGG
jgi:hypothetical protein